LLLLSRPLGVSVGLEAEVELEEEKLTGTLDA
jgi:hypothetical protein